MSVDVAIVGGGVSGLATAHELMHRGHRVVVLERQVRTGGNAVSERLGGFLMEHGPSSINASAALAVVLSKQLGLEAERCDLGRGVRRRYLATNGVLCGIATHPFAFLTSPYLSVGARLRLIAELALPRRRVDREEAVAEFFSRRFGSEFTERVIDPLVGGLFAGTPEGLSMSETFPALLAMERKHGSVTRAVALGRLAGGKMPGRRLFSWRDGIGALPRALAARLGGRIRCGVAVGRIEPTGRGFRIHAGAAGVFDAKAVVVATQPHVAAALLERLDREGAEAAAAIDAPPLAVVFLGYRRRQVAHPLDGLGYLTPRSEGRALTGALFCSTMFADRAPEGHVGLAGYVGGSRAPDLARLPSEDLVALVRSEFANLLGARGDPVVARVRQWSRGLPQYGLGHDKHVVAVRGAEQRRPGLFVTGNYLRGLPVAACVEQAAETTARVDEFLLGLARETSRSLPAGPIAM